ncbi:hypothetical protein PJE062_4415 [Pseudovibrio sp. JE062]|nr:hypothetical protein PJE062_4415 [Pseudovibrio sp. JE062]
MMFLQSRTFDLNVIFRFAYLKKIFSTHSSSFGMPYRA